MTANPKRIVKRKVGYDSSDEDAEVNETRRQLKNMEMNDGDV